MTVTASPNVAALPQSPDLTSMIPVLQQLAQTLSTLLQTLQAQLATQAQTTAAGGALAGAALTTGGGPTAGIVGASTGCGCGGGASGAAAGAATLGTGGALGGPNGDDPLGAAGGRDTSPGDGPAAGDKRNDKQPAKSKTKTREADGPKATSPGDSSKGQQIVDYAKQFLGKPYVYGADGPGSFDCSGLTMFAMKHFGINLPHHAADQAKMGTPVDKQDLQPGDLIFFSNSSEGIHHVGMYVGDGKFIHAPHTGDVVKISSLSDSYYQKEYDSARRFV